MPALYEQYRPATFDAVVGQDKAVATLRRLSARGLGGRAILLTGGTGTGKTTLARILAREWGTDWTTEEIDATGLAPSDIEALSRRCAGRPLSGHGWVVIVNEIQGISKASLTKLLTALEDSANTSILWIFTTTVDGAESLADRCADFRPFVGRVNHVSLAARGLAESFATRAQQIAQQEGLDGKPFDAYLRLVKDCRNSMRETLSRIENGAMLDD
jgi:DNA polymerase III delta prime subunit